MYAAAYFQEIRDLLAFIEDKQMEATRTVAKTMAHVIRQGQRVHLLDNGHLLGNEMQGRAGGFPLLNVLTKDEVYNPALVRRDDMVIIASVSGRSDAVVSAALRCKQRGTSVVALTSTAQANVAKSEHSSGKLLIDVADFVIDIGGKAGDGLLEINGLDERACPGSGIASVVVMWALLAQAAGHLIEGGMVPTVFTSVNVPGGEEALRIEEQRFRDLGY